VPNSSRISEYEDGIFPSVFTLSGFSAGLLVFACLLLSGCGEDGGTAKETATSSAVKKYYETSGSLGGHWEAAKVYEQQDDIVTVEMMITDKMLARRIQAHSRMEQMHIARSACPKSTAKLWTTFRDGQSLKISLNGSTGHIINALCKR